MRKDILEFGLSCTVSRPGYHPVVSYNVHELVLALDVD